MDGDIYRVTVANPSGAVTRDTVISVIRSPQIVTVPETNYKIFTGSKFNITVNATGGFIYYIWHREGLLLQVSLLVKLLRRNNDAIFRIPRVMSCALTVPPQQRKECTR